MLGALAGAARADVGPPRKAPAPKCDPDKPGEKCVLVDEGGGPLGGYESEGVCARAPDGKAYCKFPDSCYLSGTKKSIACPPGLVTELPEPAPPPEVEARSCNCSFEKQRSGAEVLWVLAALFSLRRRR
jgi:hypothetical protein